MDKPSNMGWYLLGVVVLLIGGAIIMGWGHEVPMPQPAPEPVKPLPDEPTPCPTPAPKPKPKRPC